MRILHCIPSMTGGGAERQLGLLASAQARGGDDVHVAMFRSCVHIEGLRAVGATVHLLTGHARKTGRSLPAALRLAVAVEVSSLVWRLKPDVVQTWLPPMDLIGGMAACVRRVPWVLSERSSAPQYPDGPLTFARKALAEATSAIVANSGGGREYWTSILHKGVPVEVIPNAISVKAIDEASPAPSSSRDTLVLFVGRLSDEKGPLEFVDAMARLPRDLPVRALLCGDGQLRGRIDAAIAAANLGARVSVVGYREDVWSLLKAAGALVSTSRFEGRPNAVEEAMAARCPVILSDITGHREIADESTALFVPCGDSDGFAAAVVETLRRGPAVEERVRQARRAVEHRSVTDIARRYGEVYKLATRPASLARACAALVPRYQASKGQSGAEGSVRP